MLQDYYIPKSIADTLALLKDNNGRARIIAGAQILYWIIKQKRLPLMLLSISAISMN